MTDLMSTPSQHGCSAAAAVTWPVRILAFAWALAVCAVRLTAIFSLTYAAISALFPGFASAEDMPSPLIFIVWFIVFWQLDRVIDPFGPARELGDRLQHAAAAEQPCCEGVNP
jgi:hypothetical protein